MKNLKLILGLVIALTTLNINAVSAQSKKNLIVVVKYKTQPNKDSLALFSLMQLIAKVKKEPNYKNIIVHTNPLDKTDIMLYEEWSDEAYYKGAHMATIHLRKFMGDSRAFLAGPPEITFWNYYK